MKKNVICFLLTLIIFSSIFAINLITAEESIELDYSQIELTQTKEITTKKEKDGETQKRVWKGIRLKEILKEYEIEHYKRLAFSSLDNYLVHLTKYEIDQHDPLIALFQDNKRLEDNNRLVIPEMPAMYWIRDIKEINVEYLEFPGFPDYIYFAENRLDQIEIHNNPTPFTEVKGYYFQEFIQNLIPQIQGEFRLFGRDGISHNLNYDKYLSKSVLIKTETGYMLQSTQMPGGMWIKDIAVIQKEKKAVIFRDQFDNWQEVSELSNWQDFPDKLEVYISNNDIREISTDTKFNDNIWQNIIRIKTK